MSKAVMPYDTPNQATKYHNISASGNSRVVNGNVYGNLIYQDTASPSLREQCLQSLAFSDMMQRRDGIADKTDDTCEWILEHDQYTDWCRQGGLLWVKGRAGTGKSTLMRSILRHTEQYANDDTLVLWYFFHRRGSPLQYSVLGLQRSLLHQVLSRHESLLDSFIKESDFEKRCKNEGKPGEGWNWTESDLWEHLTRTSHLCAAEQTLSLYIDALDEAGEAVARDLMLKLGNLRAKVGSRLKTCISCRPYPDVMWNHDYMITMEKCNDQDIAAYLDAQFKRAAEWRSQDDMDAIKASLLSRASGVFQWIVLVTRRILHLRKESIALIMDEIKRVPEELGDLYESMLGQLSATDQTMALSLLRWITFAARPLTVVELRYAVTIDPTVPLRSTLDCHKSSRWCSNDEEMSNRLSRLSRGLASVVEIAKNELIVGFDHESVQDYMLERGIVFLERHDLSLSSVEIFGQQHDFLSTCCVRFLGVSDVLDVERPGSVHLFNGLDISMVPFLAYAIHHWGKHAALAESNGVSQADLIAITKWPAFEVWTHWHRLEEKLNWIHHSRTTLQHVAARYGLSSVLKGLLPRCRKSYLPSLTGVLLSTKWRPDSIDVTDTRGMTPLSMAAEHGQTSIVSLLLSTGQVDVNSKCSTMRYQGETPLMKAIRGSHTEAVKLLLQNRKTKVNCKYVMGETPLMIAAGKGCWEIVRLLLKAGKVWLDAKDMSGETALFKAAKGGNLAIVRLLLDKHQVDVDTRNVSGETPLFQAVRNGHEDVAELLLQHCSDLTINLKPAWGETPLSFAASKGLERTVRLLLDTGRVDINSQNRHGQTPLMCAASKGHAGIVKVLRDTKQVDVNQRDKDYNSTPLALAARIGHEEVVATLLADSRIETNARDYGGRTPLSLASRYGREEVVNMLVADSRVETDARDKLGMTPLLWAAASGRKGTVKLLLESGRVDVSLRDTSKNWTALDWALDCGLVTRFHGLIIKEDEEGYINTAKLLEQYMIQE